MERELKENYINYDISFGENPVKKRWHEKKRGSFQLYACVTFKKNFETV